MVYRYKLSLISRLLLLPGISAVLVLGSLAALLFWNPLIGLLLLALSAFLGYRLLKFFNTHLKSIIRISDESVSGITAVGGEYSIPWEKLSLSGEFVEQGGEREVFLYSDDEDLLIRIPLRYYDAESMSREIEEHAGEFVRWEGESRGLLEENLRKRFVLPAETGDEEGGEAGEAGD